MKKVLNEIVDNTRAAVRLVLGGAIVLGLGIPLVGIQMGIGLFKGNNTVIPNILYHGLSKMFGLKVQFNRAANPTDKQKFYVANHISIFDFLALGIKVKGTFAGKGDLLKNPLLASALRAVRYIGLRRDPKYNAQSKAKLIKNMNAGDNTILFPEATTTPGKTVALFHFATLGPLYGDAGVDKKGVEVKLDKDVMLQPLAIVVKEVNGQNAVGNDELRDKYAMYNENNTLKRIWKRLKIREIKLEVTELSPLTPSKYPDAMTLANEAAYKIAQVVNPGQTEFESATIPGHENRPKKRITVTPLNLE
jgi:1-acyl-sn-glycerol-3-phosphate acyltransferase